MAVFTIAGNQLELDRESVERAVARELPEPVQEHYVVIAGRRYPPKQVIARATGLDRADFTTHQARRILKRLGFQAARKHSDAVVAEPAPGSGPYGGRQAAVLEPYRGKWVAMAGPLEVLVAAETPQEILRWLAEHERRAPYGMFRVPQRDAEAEGATLS